MSLWFWGNVVVKSKHVHVAAGACSVTQHANFVIANRRLPEAIIVIGAS